MRQRVWALYRAAFAVCVSVVSLTALGKPPARAGAPESSNWYWQNPLPRGYSVPSLACPTVTTCYVVHYNDYYTPEESPGIVLVTHDAGATWHSTVVSAGAILAEIACAGAQTCRVVGSAGMFATADGAMTWQRQLLDGGEQLPQVAIARLVGDAGSARLMGNPGIACPAVDTCFAVSGLTIVATHARGRLRSSR